MNDELEKKFLEFIISFFTSLEKEHPEKLPQIFKIPSKWAIIKLSHTLACLRISTELEQKITEFQNKRWNPLPGFIVEDGPAAINMAGTDGYFCSNMVSNTNSFKVNPGASFTVFDHLIEFTYLEHEKIRYKVDLAFIIGIGKAEKWESIEKRLNSLLNYTIDIWQKSYAQ